MKTSHRCMAALVTIAMIICALLCLVERTILNFPPTFPNYFAKKAIDSSEVLSRSAIDNLKRMNQLSILMWADYSDAHISNDFLSTCPELKCNITFDRRMINQSAAIVFYDRTVNINDRPQQPRLPHQHFVFFLMESAHYTSEDVFKRFEKNFYTLTMTYRRDSDIFSPFGFVRLRKIPMHTADDKWIAIAKAKPKSLVWMGSYCNTAGNREAYIKQIRRYMNVDMYGKCGAMNCMKTLRAYTGDDPCEEMLKKQYKFYIAFENSVCKDFITEKIFNRFQAHLVPIVMKRSHSEAVLPPGSFIAIDDFENVQAFVAYIRRLEENVTEYIQYYKWKDKYETVPFPGGFHIGFCQLCARIRADNGIGAIFPTESATDIRKWFIGNSDCYLNYGEIMAHSRNAKNVTLFPWTGQ